MSVRLRRLTEAVVYALALGAGWVLLRLPVRVGGSPGGYRVGGEGVSAQDLAVLGNDDVDRVLARYYGE